MKKVLIIFVCAVLLVLIPSQVKAAPTITSKGVSVNLNTFTVWFATDVTTTAKLTYGTTANDLNTVIEFNQGTYHYKTLSNLADETKYYYKITVTALDGTTASTEVESFTTNTSKIRFDKIVLMGTSDKTANVTTTTNLSGKDPKIYFGTSPNSLNIGGRSACEFRCGGESTTWTHFFENLTSNTTYYYKITMQSAWYGGNAIETEILSFTTTGVPQVVSIEPTSGPVGTQVTFTGKNFGGGPDEFPYTNYMAGFGCEINTGSPVCLGNIVSWSNDQVIVKVGAKAISGTTYLRKGGLFTISGPEFTVTSGTPPAKNTNVTPPVIDYIDNAYGCTFSTTTQDEETVKVKILFTHGSSTDKYLEQVYNLYKTNWGRYPRCTEMQFHLDHNTPIDRLTAWLKNQTISEKYDCLFSTSIADESTIRVPSLFTLDSTTDKYLGQVYDAYFDNWGRYPRCTEMQFHLDHNTPIDRLTAWLKENKPQATTNTNVSAPITPAEVTTPKIEFEDSGTVVSLKDETKSLTFKDTDEITLTGKTTPNSIVTLVIASSSPMTVTTKSDSDGYWFYVLPGPLAAGEHDVTVLVADSSGTKISGSEPISFSVTSTKSRLKVIDTLTEAGFTTTTWIIIIAAAIVIIVLIAVIVRKKPAQPKV